MQTVRFGKAQVSRFIVGGNPFSGFSHQTPDTDNKMRHYYSAAHIKEVLRQAESVGVTAVISRADYHVCRVLMEYWDEGGKLQWFAQTCPEIASPEVCTDRAAAFGATGVHIHGGVMDMLLAQGRMKEAVNAAKKIRDMGLAVGIAGHNPDVFRWAEDAKLDVDYYMCCYYNSAHRDKRAEHVSGMSEWFLEEDRQTMTQLIRQLSRPVVHYKILAAGRNDPAEAFRYAARCMRDTDAVCVGVYPEVKRDMVAEDVKLFEQALAAARGKASRG